MMEEKCTHKNPHIATIANRATLYICNECLMVWLEVKNIRNDKDAKRTVILNTNLTPDKKLCSCKNGVES